MDVFLVLFGGMTFLYTGIMDFNDSLSKWVYRLYKNFGILLEPKWLSVYHLGVQSFAWIDFCRSIFNSCSKVLNARPHFDWLLKFECIVISVLKAFRFLNVWCTAKVGLPVWSYILGLSFLGSSCTCVLLIWFHCLFIVHYNTLDMMAEFQWSSKSVRACLEGEFN